MFPFLREVTVARDQSSRVSSREVDAFHDSLSLTFFVRALEVEKTSSASGGFHPRSAGWKGFDPTTPNPCVLEKTCCAGSKISTCTDVDMDTVSETAKSKCAKSSPDGANRKGNG